MSCLQSRVVPRPTSTPVPGSPGAEMWKILYLNVSPETLDGHRKKPPKKKRLMSDDSSEAQPTLFPRSL